MAAAAPGAMTAAGAGDAISVALCVRNGATYLPEQVRSICAQTLLPTEIVLSDDASTDAGVDIVRSVLSTVDGGARIGLTVLQNDPPLGVTANFARAVGACSGELVALCDQDDRWQPDRLASMARVFAQRPALTLLHSDARLIDRDGRPLGRTLFGGLEVRSDELADIHRGRAFAVLMRRNLVTGATTVFRRRLLDAALPFPPQWIHDEWLAAIAAATGEVDAIEDCLIDYRQHAANQIGVRPLDLKQKIAKAFAPRGAKHADRVVRAAVLVGRLESLGTRVVPAALQAAREKVAHQGFRARLPGRRLVRWPSVLREAASGGYTRYDRGWQAVVQDLLER